MEANTKQEHPLELNSDQQATLTLLRNGVLYPSVPSQMRIEEPEDWRWDIHTTLSMMKQLLALPIMTQDMGSANQ
ncbi:hypothetical protein N7475_003979 [Penicillium sp. IBT 31633x]|nr:hypothetical protein N7475_003979 [Penicillium sp. IBT 31633x]